MKRYGEEEKAKRLEEWKASGKGVWEYAREAGIKGQTFSKWVRKAAGGEAGIRGTKARGS